MQNKKKKTISIFQSTILGLVTLGSQFLHAQTTHLDSINISSAEKYQDR